MEFFSRLNLDQSATRDDVEKSYKHLSRVYHPGEIFKEFLKFLFSSFEIYSIFFLSFWSEITSQNQK